ncbi:hypothetical protein [Nocardia cyriacigeorgica]|uniref:hypothetical protein n=1 Tax=Nocardia cyriacigeorgica TaxID=135487 RepID=UPI002455E98D|nr:hypothetical protein [Nocardia cyriacigeorgica]
MSGAPGAEFPPLTRMLLQADGSTTLMLEALLEAPLSLVLLEQRTCSAVALPERVRRGLASVDGDQVVRRRSELHTVTARPISRNEVTVSCRNAELASILTDTRVPIGHGLLAARRFLGRTVLATGLGYWRDADGSVQGRCAYKEYLLRDATTVVAHIREQFDPEVVPVAAVLVPQGAPR